MQISPELQNVVDVSELLRPPAVPFSIERAKKLEKQTLKLRDGRDLGYIIDGNREKPAVILVHGMFGSAGTMIGGERNDLFLVMVDRPNYGASSFHKEYTFTTWADDIRELTESLKLSKFHVVGCSSGGVRCHSSLSP